MLRIFGLLAALIITGFAFTAPAVAGLEICNETTATRSIAIAYSEKKQWTSEGWWVVKPGECKTVVGGDLKQRYYYYHASARDITFEGENYFFCATPKSFTIVGEENCKERGYQRRNFRKIDTGKKAKTFKLTLTGGSSTPKTATQREPAQQAAGPGTYGEPAAITGTLKGCRTDNDPPICEIATDEWIYVVAKDDRTPASIHAELNAIPAGTTVTVEGDIVGYGDISVDMTARRVIRAKAGSPAAGPYGKLVGLWRSTDDGQSTIRFDNGNYYSYYGGDLTDKGRYSVVQSCGGIDAEALAVDIDGDPDTYCYGVLKLDDTHLDLSYYGRGNTLSYKRDRR